MPGFSEAGAGYSCGRFKSRFLDKADVTALLGAFCFLLSAIEYMLPKPMPFMRLGIANLPILLAVDVLPFPWFLTLAVVKVVGMSIISGTLFSFVALFSLVGTLTAALVMWAASAAGGRWISQIGVSILGAVASNIVQITIARYLVFGDMAWIIAPLFIAMGLATGTALGLFAEHFARTSYWYACSTGSLNAEDISEAKITEIISAGAGGSRARGEASAAKSSGDSSGAAARAKRRERYEARVRPVAAAALGALIAVLFLFQSKLFVKLIFFALFAAAVYIAGKKFSPLTTLLVMAGIVLANLFIPSGRVLAKLGPFSITQFALLDGISKAVTFEGLMFLSKAAILPGLKIPGRIGGIVSSSFLYYDRIIEYKGGFKAASLAADADRMMFKVWGSVDLKGGGTA